MKIIFCLTILFGCVQNVLCQTNALDSIANTYLNEYKIPGLAISVIKPDTTYYGVAGHKRCGSMEGIDLDSKFQIASNAKAITATIAALLIKENMITWDSKITDIISELKGKINPAYESVTLEELLSNRGGIQPFETDSSDEWKHIPNSIKVSSHSKFDFAQYALNLEPKIDAEKGHPYSNGGFIIAALLLERCSNKTWSELIDKFNAQYQVKSSMGFPNQESPNQTFGHKKKRGKYRPVMPEDEYNFDFDFSAAGNLAISVRDMTTIMSKHLEGLLGQDNVLSSATYKKLHFGFDQYALGWYNGNIGESEQKFSYHGGSLETFSSAIIISADRKIAVIILANADDKKTNKLKDELRIELWEKYGTY